jgi:hypothetical protein
MISAPKVEKWFILDWYDVQIRIVVKYNIFNSKKDSNVGLNKANEQD